jgi:23S rRNA (pseudouridine1915-N3)-methyltransferase
MKILFVFTGQTFDKPVKELMSVYEGRISRYVSHSVMELKTKNEKGESIERIKEKEQKEQLKQVGERDVLILLDENGKQFSSVEFASQLQKLLTSSNRKIIFMTGGAYGFSNEIIKRANLKISFSKFTFTHQMIRPLLLEQVYRAFTIINNEKYHH